MFFFFQAEDGIRDLTVTGVQTCALPILVQQVRRYDVEAVEQVADSLVGIVGGAAHDADHLVALVEQQLRQVGAVLSGNAGYERGAAGVVPPPGAPWVCALRRPSSRAHSPAHRSSWL